MEQVEVKVKEGREMEGEAKTILMFFLGYCDKMQGVDWVL